MTHLELYGRHWTPRWWALCIGFVLTLQVGFVFWFSDHPDAQPRRRSSQTRVRLVPEPAAIPNRLSIAQTDPTLFALVSPDGFSRSAWLTIPPFSYAMTNPPGALRWLNLAPDDLATDFTEYVQNHLLSEDEEVNELPPSLAQPTIPLPVVVNATTLKVEGALAGRAWQSAVALPQHPEPVLGNSVVRVLVDSGGRTISAALLSSSGLPNMDQSALVFARGIRFAVLDGSAARATNESGVLAGTLVFQWARVQSGAPGQPTGQSSKGS